MRLKEAPARMRCAIYGSHPLPKHSRKNGEVLAVELGNFQGISCSLMAQVTVAIGTLQMALCFEKPSTFKRERLCF